MFYKFLATNDKLLEIAIRRAHQYHTLIDLSSVNIVMRHGIASELHEIVVNPLASLGLVALFKVNNAFRVVLNSY